MKSSPVLETSKPEKGEPPSEKVRHDKGPRVERKSAFNNPFERAFKKP
jgi:hypothetical protein